MFKRLYKGFTERPDECRTCEGIMHVMFYLPDSPSGRAIVIARPDGEEGTFSYRPLVAAARALASAHYTVVTFDYVGQGQSEGDYASTTFRTRLANLAAAWELLRAQAGSPPAVVGVRLGAAVALAAANEIPELRELVLWEPVLDTSVFVHQLLRVNVSMQMVAHGSVQKDRNQLIADARAGQPVNVNGFSLSGIFIDELLQFNARSMMAQWAGRGLIVSSAAADKTSASVWTAISVPRNDFWKEPKTHYTAAPAVVAPSIEWLNQTCNTVLG